MQTNEAGVALIKRFEGLRLAAYPDPAHGWAVPTIGYGHTSAAGAPQVKRGMRITEAEAEAVLRADLGQYERAVTEAVTVSLTGNQFSALASFTFNLGAGNLRSSTLLAKLNRGDHAGAAAEFTRWNRAGGVVLPGLTRRREAERDLFLTPDDTQQTVPNVDISSEGPVSPLTFGSINSRNRQVQTILAGMGLYTRTIDEKWGQGQQDALDALTAHTADITTLIKGA